MDTKRLENWAIQISHTSWFPLLALALITLLAAGLRFFKLGEWSFWIDEIYTINHAQRHFGSLELILENIPPARNWVPISVILTAQALNIFGVSEWSARLVSAVIGVITIPILYFPMKKIFGNQVTLIALLLLAVSPWHILWSQNARGYTSLMLLYTLALFLFYDGIERDRPKYFVFFFFLLYLATSERMIALFILPVVVFYLVLLKLIKISTPPGFRIRNFLLLLSPGILLILYQVISLLATGESIIGQIVDEIVATFYGKSTEPLFTQAIFIIFEIGIPLITLSFFSGLFWLSQKRRVGLLMFLGAVLPLIMVILLAPFMFTEERYAFVTLPSWLILAAFGIKELFFRTQNFHKIIVIGIVSLLIADAAGANLLYFHNNNGNRRDWRGAFGIVQEYIKEDDMIISTWPELGSYYLNREVILWQEMDLDLIQKSSHRTWFVVIPDMAWFTDTEDLLWWVERNARLIKTLYLRTVDNTNLEIYIYDPIQNNSLKTDW